MDNKMDNELDFRVGDVVCDIRYGTGRIEKIEVDSDWPVRVNLENSSPGMYLYDGRESHLDNLRSLYHGTWEQVFGNLPDIKPKRKVKQWVNLYRNGLGSIVAGSAHASEESARSKVNLDAIAVAVEIEVDK